MLPFQAPVQQQAAVPEKKKARGSRKPWDPARYEMLAKALAASARAIGSSYVHPIAPTSVPKDAPDGSEWNGIATALLRTVPVYADLYEKRKNLNKTEKSRDGGLIQHVYLAKEIVAFFNNSGVLGNFKFPVDQEAGGLGIATRAIVTSAMVAYIESHGLKHPVEKKYIMRDQALFNLIGEANFEAIKTMKPKTVKKRKEGAKPKKEQPRIKLLERDGQTIPHFSFDAIPAISGLFILPLVPRHVTPLQTEHVQKIREFLADLTAKRKEARKTADKNEREAKKAQKLQNNIVPTQVMTLTLNPGAGGFGQGAIPTANSFAPAGVTATPGVTFVPNANVVPH